MKERAKKIAILAFVPVLHKGYLDFFSSHEGDVFVFGPNLIKMFIHLTRDVRTIDPGDAIKALEAIFPNRRINIAEENDLLSWKYDLVIMPEDEISKDIAEKYLKNIDVKFASVFLRWNKVITFRENEVVPNRKVTTEAFHKEMIRLAFKESEKSGDWWRQIASLVVKDGKIIISAHNHHLPTNFHLSANGDPRSNFDAGQHQDIFTSIHAEAEAIAKAAKEGISLKGAAMYATTFPCPNCARLLGTAGVKTVYYSKGYSLLDAEKILDHFGVEVVLVQ